MALDGAAARNANQHDRHERFAFEVRRTFALTTCVRTAERLHRYASRPKFPLGAPMER